MSTDLPSSKIVIKSGRVTSVVEYTMWNTEPAKTLSAKRELIGFSAYIGDPEHGGRTRRGTLGRVFGALHPNVKVKYVKLFRMRVATPEKVKKLFPRHEVYVE